ncbi:Aldo/keto reductase [Melanomma pulvis-pyrius CBS 109.77]|uniref:Aldo/keto reductase n=1 Tax=Melanomma pulvis-pyrius CBS 109.77 TaxID=1314802 RepID=A0A6A6X778_9PLEO|nr:Aldo/keto reductase [Melanomma pulvis-pyrius CBS 109.77]
MPPPKIYIGSGTWGDRISKHGIEELAAALKELGVREIDTAPIYPLPNPGGAEKLIGDLQYAKKGFLIDSKILYFGNGDGTLSATAIQESLDQSLTNLKIEKLNVLYCHGPDKTTPLAEQAAALDAEFRKGKFAKLGVCNFTPEMLEEWLEIAGEKGYIKPSVFQGQYNILCRAYEEKLFPLLRKHGITFAAYSPLAGGFLTGKVTFSTGADDLRGTRFEVSDENYVGMGYRRWYDKPSMHAAVRKMQELCTAHSVEMGDAACRWVLHHSLLDGGPLLLSREKCDAVIVGPNSLSQLAKYAEAYKEGPLPDELAKGLDGLWEIIKDDASSIIVF